MPRLFEGVSHILFLSRAAFSSSSAFAVGVFDELIELSLQHIFPNFREVCSLIFVCVCAWAWAWCAVCVECSWSI
jgi:hypothetical protein